MGKFKLFVMCFLAVFATVFLAGCGGDSDTVVVNSSNKTDQKADTEKKYKVYLITMDLVDDFWKSIDRGCRQAVEEIGEVDYEWIGPDQNLDGPQMECIDKAVAEGANAILLASSSPRGVIPALEKAAAAGVKIIYVDNPSEFDSVAFLATDNEAAGKTAGETLKQKLADEGITSGVIGLSANKDNVTSTNLRNKGFSSVFEGTGFTLADIFYMEDNDQSLKDYAAAHPEYVAFFGSNERTARNIGEQMREMDSKQIVMGFDTSDSVLTLINDGYIFATIQQKPEVMGHDGIKIAVDALKGTFTETNKRIDTGVTVIHKDSI